MSVDTEPGPISQAVTEALKDAPLLPRDAPAVQLVTRYAAQLDAAQESPDVLADLGPKLLAALTALGWTPAGRNVKGGTGGPVVFGALDELRARRAKRAG